MAYIVTNLTTGEEAAALGDLEMAKKFADGFAERDGGAWAVIESRIVYKATAAIVAAAAEEGDT